jgi:hypothetical protein
MRSQLHLVGLVAATRCTALVVLGAGLAGALPVVLGHRGGLSAAPAVVLAVGLFAVPFGWAAGPRRAWYRERLADTAPAPDGVPVVAARDAFDRVSRPLTRPVLLALAVGLAIAWATGVPVGLALAGLGCGLLLQARWLAAQERRGGRRLLCPLTPLRVDPGDPHLALYRRVPFYVARAAAPTPAR